MEKNEAMVKIPKALYRKIEEDVVRLHVDLGLSIPVDPYEVVKRLGFVVRYISEIIGFEDSVLIESVLGKNKDGISHFDPDIGTFVIWINDIKTDYEPRINFTIMHEVGHIRMGHKVDSELAERIANYYASYALVPTPLPELFNCESREDIMNVFEISVYSADYCIKRYWRWRSLPKSFTSYEKELRNYYKKIINNENE